MKRKSKKSILTVLALMSIVSAGRLVDVSEAEEIGQMRQETSLSSQSQGENKEANISNQGENEGEDSGANTGEKEKLKQVSTFQANTRQKVIIPEDPRNLGETPEGYVPVKLDAYQ